MENKEIKPVKPVNPFVQRKRRKIVAWVIAGICLVCVFSLGTISFLGQYSGHFTAKLDDTTGQTLTMSEDDFTASGAPETGTNYLKAEGLGSAYVIDADDIPTLGSSKYPDRVGSPYGSRNVKQNYGATCGDSSSSSSTSESSGSDCTSFDSFFAYTFFLKNTSATPINYLFSFVLDDEILPTNLNDSTSLGNILRVRIYENSLSDGQETHEQTTYAKESSSGYYLEDGTYEGRECISKFKTVTYTDGDGVIRTKAKVPDEINAENNGFADRFYNYNEGMLVNKLESIKLNEVKRYTAVVWLDGNDPDTLGKVQPQGGSVTFSIHFNIQSDKASSSSSSSSETSNS